MGSDFNEEDAACEDAAGLAAKAAAKEGEVRCEKKDTRKRRRVRRVEKKKKNEKKE